MLRPQFFPRRHHATQSVAARLAEIQTAAQTGALSTDELRGAVYRLVGLPPGFGQQQAQQRPEHDLKHARAS